MRYHLFLNSMCNLVKMNQSSFLFWVPCQYFLAPLYHECNFGVILKLYVEGLNKTKKFRSGIFFGEPWNKTSEKGWK